MKGRISATLDKDTIRMLDDLMKDETLNFRNYSHIVEYCIKKSWGEKYGKFKK